MFRSSTSRSRENASEKYEEYNDDIHASGKHLLGLINDILDMAKVEAGKMTLRVSELPIREILYEIFGLIENTGNKKNLQMSIDVAKDFKHIQADALKIKQIFYNLLSNAIKFTPDGGKIGIKAIQTDTETQITIWDTGTGIAAENIEIEWKRTGNGIIMF